MKMDYRNGLLFASVEITYNGKSKKITDVVIDTGAAKSIFSSDVVDELGVFAEPGDKISSFFGIGGSAHHAFAKTIDLIKFDSAVIRDIDLDFGLIDIDGKINGLLGLDVLVKSEAIIDLKEMTVKVKAVQ